MKTKNQPLHIALIGECMIELQGELFGALKQSWGGDTYNTAVYLRRLLPDTHQVHYITGLGNDLLSQQLIYNWQQQRLKTDFVVEVVGRTPGLYQITTDEYGERSFHYWRNEAAAKYIFDEMTPQMLLKQLNCFDYVYLSGISLAILTPKSREILMAALTEYARGQGNIIFDNNYRPRLWDNKFTSQRYYHQILSLTSIALLTFDDEQALWDVSEVEETLAMWASCPEVVIKRGAKGCLIKYSNEQATVAAESVSNVVDTTAAGDSFAAGYVFGRLSHLSPASAAEIGHRLAGEVIQHPGAIIREEFMPQISV